MEAPKLFSMRSAPRDGTLLFALNESGTLVDLIFWQDGAWQVVESGGDEYDDAHYVGWVLAPQWSGLRYNNPGGWQKVVGTLGTGPNVDK